MIGLMIQDPAGGPKPASGSGAGGVEDRVRDLNKINNDHLTSKVSHTTTDNYYIPYSGAETTAARTAAETGGSWGHQRQGPPTQRRPSDGTRVGGGGSEVGATTTAPANSLVTPVCNGVPPSLSAHNATTDNSGKASLLHMESTLKAGGRAKPPDYDDAWYEEADGQFYNQYDWYQDENGEWQYDYRLEEQGLVQNELGEWVAVCDKVPTVVGLNGDKDQKVELANNFRTKDDTKVGSTIASVTSSSSANKKNAQGLSGPRAKPPDYDDAWYEEADGQFYNQYDWYQDENGEWQYDYRLEEQGLVQNELGEWVAEEEITPQSTRAKESSQVARTDNNQKPKVPSPTDRSKPISQPPSDIPKSSSSSTMFKGLSNFGSGLVGAAASAAKEAASSAALAVDSMSDVADAAMEAMPDIELPQVALPAKTISNAVTTSATSKGAATNVTDVRSNGDSNNSKKEPVVQQRSSDGFSQLFSSASVSTGKEASASLSTVKTSLPPRPADYDDFWYQADNGNWYNEYDDMGYEFADEEILVVEEHETVVVTPPAAVDAKVPVVKLQKPQQEITPAKTEVPSTKLDSKEVSKVQSIKKQPRPEDYDDFWYQDDDGQWKNEYDDLGYTFEEDEEEEFYTEEELAKEEAKLFMQKSDDQPQHQTQPKINQTDKKAEESVSAIIPLETKAYVPIVQAEAEKKKPADYEDHWFQDYDGNWYNEYDHLEEEKTMPPATAAAPMVDPVASVEAATKKEKKTVSFDKEDTEHQLAATMGSRPLCRNPKDRWQWAFTRIVQVGDS